jgi:hypothetical protein
VDDGHVTVASHRHTSLRRPFEDQDDVAVEVGGDQLLVQTPSGAGPVLPPAVGTRADDVGTVDDQYRRGTALLRYFEKSFGRSSAAASFS